MNNEQENCGLISCIIPVYNRQQLIVESVESVLAQSYTNYEIIIVDDGSTDHTAKVIHELATKYPNKIRLYNQSNQGPGVARQLGLDHAKGEYVQFLDSDDLILPAKFELSIDAFNHPDRPGIVYGITHYYEKSSPENYIVWKDWALGQTTILPGFFKLRIWSTSSPIYRKSLLKNAGKILPLCCEEDLEYDCRIGLQKPGIFFINKHLTDFRHHTGTRFSIENPNRARQLSHRIQARKQIYQTMLEYGLNEDSPQMKEFAKFMFLLARQAGELKLPQESKTAFELAKIAGAKLSIENRLAMNIYPMINLVVGQEKGSRLFSKIYSHLHHFRQKKPTNLLPGFIGMFFGVF